MYSLRLTAGLFALVSGLAAGSLAAASLKSGADAHWPQFRGAEGSGVAAKTARPPVQFGPGTNVAWQVALPPGNASPVIWGARLFLTACENGKLITLALDTDSGREV